MMTGNHIVVGVDNISCLYAWERGYSKDDNTASVLVRTLTMLCAKLSCVVHVVHVPRDTTWESKLVDRLSRKITTSQSDKALLAMQLQQERASYCRPFKDCMMSPTEDWDLYLKIIPTVNPYLSQ